MPKKTSKMDLDLKKYTYSKLTQLSSRYFVRTSSSNSEYGCEYDGIDPNILRRPTTEIWPAKLKRHTFDSYTRLETQGTKLFTKVMDDPPVVKNEENLVPEDSPSASILVTGFGMRNASSLQRLLMKSQKKQKYISKYDQRLEEEIEEEFQDYESALSASSKTETSSRTSDTLTQTDLPPDQKQSLEYLLGLEAMMTDVEEEAAPMEPKKLSSISGAEKKVDEYALSSSKSMREAQKYLRTHRVFEFFQFIIAHLLSSQSKNPIDFIIDLLNKCLLYRSGLGNPPVLYEKQHIEQLFKMMDPMNTGFVEICQYHAAMKTFGICTYNENPTMTNEQLVSRDTFVEEIFDSEVDIFNELIKRHKIVGAKPSEDLTLIQPRDLSKVSHDSIHLVPREFFQISKKKYEEKHSLDG